MKDGCQRANPPNQRTVQRNGNRQVACGAVWRDGTGDKYTHKPYFCRDGHAEKGITIL